MITSKLGTMVGDETIYMSSEMLTESVIGQIYELQIKTVAVPCPECVAATLSKKLREKFGATLLYFEIDDDIMTLQLEGSPFAWNALLVFLPEILKVLGVVVMFIMVYLVTSSIPSWQYGLAAIAITLVYIAPSMISKITMMKVKK